MYKNYSFKLHKIKHKDIIKWLEKQQKQNGINISALIRLFIKKRMEENNDTKN
jgi:hypothetical protein